MNAIAQRLPARAWLASEQVWLGWFVLMALLSRTPALAGVLLALAMAVVLGARWLPMRWRLFAGLAWLNAAYMLGSEVARELRPQRFDDMLATLDALLGWHAGAWTPAPPTLDLLACFYLSFYALLVAGFVVFRNRPAFHAGLAWVFGLGTLGYVLVPAAGPFFTHPLPVAGTHVFARLQPWAHQLVTGVDVFPSLHVAVSAYVLAWVAASRRGAWPLALAWAAGIAAATIGLRYHYLVDAIAGAVLAASVLLLQRRAGAFASDPSCPPESLS